MDPHRDRWNRRLQLWLRFCAGAMGLAFLAAFLPTAWMLRSSTMLGIEPLPDLPLFQYLARSLSLLYALYGSLMWVTASDPRRFAPVVTYMAVGDVLFGTLVGALDLYVGMPVWWALTDFSMATTGGLVTLFLQRRAGA